jgi:hypothetical protein
MKKFILIIATLCLFLFTNAQVLRYEMFVEKNQKAITEEQKASIDSLKQMMTFGESIRIFPLYNDTFLGYVLFPKYAKEIAQSIADYAVENDFELLGMPRNFPSTYRGISVSVHLKCVKRIIVETQTPSVSLFPETEPLSSHFPPKPSQYFIIDPKVDNFIEGKEGTKLFFEAGSLMTDEIVKIELKEFYKLDDFVKNGLSTSSNGQMIETGGTIYLNATEEESNKEVKINPETGVDVEFTDGKGKPDMQVFVKDPSSEEWNWILPPQSKRKVKITEVYKDRNGKIVSKKTFNSEEEYEQYLKDKEEEERRKREEEARKKKEAVVEALKKGSLTDALRIYSFGYINCDRFINQPMLQFAVLKDKNISAEYYLVFGGIKGIMQGRVEKDKVHFGQVHDNSEATLMAVAFIDGQAYYFGQKLKLTKYSNPTIKLEKVSEEFVNEQLAMVR